jgi:DNA polymerase I
MKNIYVIDAYNLIYRMFYAVPEMHTRDGQIVNAVFGVVKFIKSLAEMSPNDTILVASESGSNFRETLFSEYKGTRDRMPDNLRSQITLIFEFFEATGIPVLVRE